MSTKAPEFNGRMLPLDPGLEQLLTAPDQLSAEQQTAPMTAAREAELRRLLDPAHTDHRGHVINYGNFDHARESGLLDEFAYDPERHLDGVLHLLVGEMSYEGGKRSIQGFHINHDPEYVKSVYQSYEDMAHLEGASSKHRKKYIERPFEPRRAQVIINGYEKSDTHLDENGKPVVERVNNSMFPREYDPLAVLKAVAIAKNTRDRSLDIEQDGVVVTLGEAPMIDGETPMHIFMVLTKDEKVITAFPKVKESGYMKLTDMAINEALGLKKDATV